MLEADEHTTILVQGTLRTQRIPGTYIERQLANSQGTLILWGYKGIEAYRNIAVDGNTSTGVQKTLNSFHRTDT